MQAYLILGAEMAPRRRMRINTSGCSGGIWKMCFRKNVFSSDSCQNMTSWQTARVRMAVFVGSSQRIAVQDSGVNCITARFSLPVVLRISLQAIIIIISDVLSSTTT